MLSFQSAWAQTQEKVFFLKKQTRELRPPTCIEAARRAGPPTVNGPRHARGAAFWLPWATRLSSCVYELAF